MSTSISNQVDKLNSLLQGELSAVETYTIALEKAKSQEVIAVLNECLSDHRSRASQLSPLVSSAGAFAKAVAAGAVVLGEGAAIGSLKEGEDHGLQSYQSEVKHLEGPALEVVQKLLIAQESTQTLITKLADKK